MESKTKQIRLALLLAVFCALGPFTVDMYISSFPEIMEFYSTNASMVQLSLTAALIGLSLGQLIIGPLSDMYGRKVPLLGSMILFAIFSISCLVSLNIEMFIVFRFLQGFTASAGLVIARAMVRDLYDGVELTKFFALLTTITNVTPLISPLTGSAIATYVTWRGIFLFTGLIGLILTAITIWRVQETLPKDNRIPSELGGTLRNFVTLGKDKTFVGYALSSGILFGGCFAYISGSPFIYQNIYGVSPQVFSILFALNGISLMIEAQIVKWLADKKSSQHIFQIGLWSSFVSGILVLLVVLLHGPLVTLVISLFLSNLSLGMIGPVSFTLAIESLGHIAGSASALLGVLPFLLGSITSPLVGIMGEYSAIPLGVIMFTTGLLAVLIHFFLLRTNSN